MSGSTEIDREVKIIEEKPLSDMKTFIIGLPDVGLVGLITVNHLIQSLNISEIGHIESKFFPPVIVVHKSEPKAPTRLYGKEDMAILTSEIPVSSSVINPLVNEILDWTASKGADLVVSLSGTAVQNRLEIEKPEIYAIASTEKARNILEEKKIQMLEEGFMVGPYAAILKESIKRQVDSVVLLSQSHYQYPDPGAAASMINALNNLLGVNVEVTKLLEQAEEIRLKTREIMQRTNKNMQQMNKMQEQEIPAMYV